MRRIKIYKYPHALPHLHDQIPGYENSVPFSEAGIAKWCELVDPKDAELFYCGQFSDTQPIFFGDFEHWRGNQERHVFDIEGDMGMRERGPYIPGIYTAMNAGPEHRNMNLMVRPGCSMLLKDLLKRPSDRVKDAKKGFYFRGQRDPYGLREKVKAAFKLSGLPGVFEFTDRWHCPTPATDPAVAIYEAGMNEWQFALCPAGHGQATQRFLEAVMMDRIPLVIADNLLFENSIAMGEAAVMFTGASIEQLARWMQRVYDNAIYQNRLKFMLERYFDDPTLYFIKWMMRRGILAEDKGAAGVPIVDGVSTHEGHP